MSKRIKIPNLSNAKIGDKLWDSLIGEWVTICEIDLSSHEYPIHFRYNGSKTICYCRLSGQISTDSPARYYWQPFAIPEECFVRPSDPLPPDGTLGWGKYQYEDDDQWIIGYLQREGRSLYVKRTPTDTTGWSLVDQFTTEDPYAKENYNG